MNADRLSIVAQLENTGRVQKGRVRWSVATKKGGGIGSLILLKQNVKLKKKNFHGLSYGASVVRYTLSNIVMVPVTMTGIAINASTRDIQRLPTTPFSLVSRKEYFNIVTVHRETLTQYITFKRGGRTESVLLHSVVLHL